MSTPRTDAAEVDLNEVTCTAFVGEKQVIVKKYVPAYKMRKMERELSRVPAACGGCGGGRGAVSVAAG